MKLCLQFCWSVENQESGENTSELEHITEVRQAIMFSSRVFIFFWFLTWQVSSKQRHSQVNFMMFWANLNGFSVSLVQEFNKKSNSLYTILRSSRLIGSQRAPYLRRFLMRLNFNFFFEVIQRKGSLSNIQVLALAPSFSNILCLPSSPGNCKRCHECSQTSSRTFSFGSRVNIISQVSTCLPEFTTVYISGEWVQLRQFTSARLMLWHLKMIFKLSRLLGVLLVSCLRVHVDN